MIAIINYGSGNVRAIGNIYDKLRIPYIIAEHPDQLESAAKLILPGVGAFDETIRILNKSGFKEVLNFKVLEEKLPVLGICVGMQILSYGSEEGVLEGLGWIPGRVKQFDKKLLEHKPKLPHLGWNTVEIQKTNPIMADIDQDKGFYFLHSYYFDCDEKEDQLTLTNYGIKFCSSVNRANIFGTQFHPEKSHNNGVTLLKNFAIM